MTKQITYEPAIIVSAEEVLGDYKLIDFKKNNIGRFITLAEGDRVRTYGLLVDKVDLQKRARERGRYSGAVTFDVKVFWLLGLLRMLSAHLEKYNVLLVHIILSWERVF